LLLVLFYVLFVCKCVLPPGVNPIAVNKCTISNQKRTPRSKWRNERIERKKIKQRGKGQEEAGATKCLDKIREGTTSNLKSG